MVKKYYSITTKEIMIPKTSARLTFQKEFAFFNSINWNATSKNLIAEIPKIRKIAGFEIALVEDDYPVCRIRNNRKKNVV